jgi:hypothetical protein
MTTSQRVVRVLSNSWLHLVAPTSSAVIPSTDINVDRARAEALELEKMGIFSSSTTPSARKRCGLDFGFQKAEKSSQQTSCQDILKARWPIHSVKATV